jgi:hypothetical protein
LTTDEAMSEREPRDTAATTRVQSVVHYIERDIDDAARLVGALAERSPATEGGPTLLVIVPGADDALALAAALRSQHRDGGPTIAPITTPARGKRLLSTGPMAIAGSASDLAALVAESRLSLGALQCLVVIWPEEIVVSEHVASLDQVMAEVPRTAERVSISASRTPELAQFLERAMWRARSVDHTSSTSTPADATVRVMAVVPGERLRALRTVLDAFDPPGTVLMAFSDESEAAARDAAAILGVGGLIAVSRGVPDERFGLGIIVDDVPTAEDLAAAAATTNELIAIVRPTRLAAFHKVAGNASPLSWTGAVGNARSIHDSLREEIRGTAGSGTHLVWIPVVEPLLEGLDAVDIAAAALAMLDRERRRSKKAAVAVQAAAPVEREKRPDAFRRPDRDDRRGDRPDRGGPRSRDTGGWKGRPGQRDDTRRGPPRDRTGRPGQDDRGRESRFRDDSRDRRPPRDNIERAPRAAGESREWTERSERLRNARREPPRKDDGST